MATDYIINPDRIQSFFTELETRKTLLSSITDLHKTLTTHFTSLSQNLAQKTQTLDSQIDSFNFQSKKSLESLENRENAIPDRESASAARIEEQKALAISEIENWNTDNAGERKKHLPEVLRMCFRRMDCNGLVKFMHAKRKESAALRAELAAVVDEAVDALGLVLEAVEDFVGMKIEGKFGMADRRWACAMLIQAVVPLPEGSGKVLVAKSLKERAAGVLEKWKGVLGGGEGSGGVGASEASMFLQMVIGFGLKENFEEGFLRKLVLEFAGRRDMAKLAVALGFVGEKMGDVINELVKSGKEIEAVYFASESGLTQQFDPISLLKSCLKNCRKKTNYVTKGRNYSAAAVDEANKSEMNTTRAIIKCVEDHKLESQFTTIDSLKKWLTQREKAKAEKKKKSAAVASTSKPNFNKRAHEGSSSRAGGCGPSFRPPKSARFSNTSSPAFRQRDPPFSHQAPAPRFSAQYGYPSPTAVYDGHAAPSYGSAYAGPYTRSPVRGLASQYTSSYAAAPEVGGRGGALSSSSSSYVGGQGASYGGQSSNYSAAAGVPAAPTYHLSSYPQ